MVQRRCLESSIPLMVSTVQAARICHMSPNTVRAWIERGQLDAIITEGAERRYRQIPYQSLREFMARHGYPVEDLDRLVDAPPPEKKVLVADDERDYAKGVKHALQRDRRLAVEVAYSWDEALERMGKFEPDLVLLDLRLPGLQGDEVLRALRPRKRKSERKVLVYSADPEEDVRRDSILKKRLKALGAEDFVTKAESLTELRDTLYRILGICRRVELRVPRKRAKERGRP